MHPLNILIAVFLALAISLCIAGPGRGGVSKIWP
jgi:hypothetical protein